MKIKSGFIATICALGALILLSCDNPVSLGKRLNLDPPIVTITGPDFMENISGDFEITGTATDLEEVVFLTVSIERILQEGDPQPEWRREWQAERGRWLGRTAEDTPWESIDGPDWTQVGGKRDITWSVNVSIDGAGDGEYLITAWAENNVKNEGSKIQRRVIIDKYPPVVTVFTPVLRNEALAAAKGYFEDPDNGYRLRNPQMLDQLHNKSIRLQYDVEDSFSLAALKFLLVGNDDKIYYEKALSEPPSWSGRVEVDAKEIIDPETKAQLKEKTYLKVISIASDRAGNSSNPDKIYSHGWLVWWPEADRPWVEGVGHETDFAGFNVFPKATVEGQAYDNDGVAKVSYTLYKADGTTLQMKDEEGKTITWPVIKINEPLVEGGTPSAFFAWRFTAPEDTGDYYIVIDCEDINKEPTEFSKGITETRYFHVLDTNAPKITFVSPTPPRDASLFGNGAGSFTIKGFADDGTDPVQLDMVWLHPKGDAETRVKYRSADDDVWKFTGIKLRDSGDPNANLCWNLTDVMSSKEWVEGDRRWKRDFEITLNLFSDLGIGTTADLTNQSFIFRLQGDNKRAITEMVTFRGDTEAPELAITGLKHARGGVERGNFEIRGGKMYYLDNGNEKLALEPLADGDKITITGTWSDDSVGYWTTAWTKDRMGPLTVTWNGTKAEAELTDTSTWTATYTVIAADVVRGGGYIVANLKDFGGNNEEATVDIAVDTTFPILLSASSTNPNGFYKTSGDITLPTEITVTLQFNKAVRFWGETGKPPRLELNVNGDADGNNIPAGKTRYAEFVSGAEESRVQSFTYKIEPGDNTFVSATNARTRLTVKNILVSGDSQSGFQGGLPGWYSNGMIAAATVPDLNLGKTKEIYIDTVSPKIVSVRALGGDPPEGTPNHYKAGVNVFLLVEFDEEIRYTGGASLALNATGNGASVSKSTPSGNKELLFEYEVGESDNTPNNSGIPAQPLKVEGFTNFAASITDPAGNPLNLSGSTPDNINVNSNPNFAEIGHPDRGENWAREIYIDTIPPNAPTWSQTGLTGTDSGTLGTPLTGPPTATISIGGNEANARVEYQTADGGSWINYTAAIGLPVSNAVYQVKARQTDLAGNESSVIGPIYVRISQSTPLLQSFSGPSAGTYKAGASITITLNLREAVTVGGTGTMSLVLNNGRTVSLSGGNGTKNLSFTFTVATGDHYPDTDLAITSINMTDVTLRTVANPDIKDDLPTTGKTGKATSATDEHGLDYFTKIRIDTSTPSFTRAVLSNNGTNLTIAFNKPIYKGTGNITLTVSGNSYRIPAVLTKSEYLRYHSTTNNPSTDLSAYYKAGTNGTNASWVADTDEKYILDFALNTTNADGSYVGTGNANTARTRLRNAGADKVVVSVASGAVTVVNTANTGTLTVNLNTFVLPVKGVNYTLTFPSTLVQDNLSNNLSSDQAINDGGVNSLNNPGINPPVIRIERSKGTVSAGNTPKTTTQPTTANAKIDCQTPGVPLKYTYVSYTTPPVASSANTTTLPAQAPPGTSTNQPGPFNGTSHPSRPPAGLNGSSLSPAPASSANGGTMDFPIGYDNIDNGYLFDITATAGTGASEVLSWERAARSVIRFEDVGTSNSNSNTNNWGTLRDRGTNNNLRLWLRGGDQPSGANLTPGFPLTWDETDWNGATIADPSGARLMTNDTTTATTTPYTYTRANSWYWITWEVTVRPALFHFIAGTVGTSELEVARGPIRWSWGKNSWAFQHDKYPLYPGGSLIFRTGTINHNNSGDVPNTSDSPYNGTWTTGMATAKFEFYDNFSGRRD
jgi:hypothetical protein